MAQINITLNQEEILELLSENHDGAFRKLLSECLNSILKVESQEQLKAEPYQRTEERTDSRNGFRDRQLNTRIGKITLHVPRHRNQPFKTMLFENYKRSEAALVATMAEMVVCGVATRKVSKVMETLCDTPISKSAVSDACKELDQHVKEFQDRPITSSYPFVTVDATYFKVRENGKVISKAFMIAYATNSQGHHEVIGFRAYPKESIDTWTDFLNSLKKRGLKDMLMITSDANEGIRRAICEVFPDIPWQRCQFHFSRNISDKVPKKYQAGLRSELQEMFNAPDIESARRKKDEIIKDYSDVAEAAMNCLDEGFDDSMTARLFPSAIYKHYRTSNHIERLNEELKRRSKAIGIFPNEDSLIRLMGSVLIEYHEGRQEVRKIFSEKTIHEILKTETPLQLKQIALDQKNLLAA